MIISRADAEKEQNLHLHGVNTSNSMGASLLPAHNTAFGGETDAHTAFRGTLMRDDAYDGSTLRDKSVAVNFAPLAEKNRDSDVTATSEIAEP